MHNNSFHWKNEYGPALDRLVEMCPSSPPMLTRPPNSRFFLRHRVSGAELDCPRERNCLHGSRPGLTAAWLLAKPLPSSTCFHKTPMNKNGAVFEARFERMNCGHLIAADVEFDGYVARIPSWEKSEPYLVSSLPGARSLFYGSAEAMSHLKPESLTTAKYGTLLLPAGSQRFFQHLISRRSAKFLTPWRAACA